MIKQLPESPNPDHLRKQAKQLLAAYRAGTDEAIQRFAANLPSFKPGSILALHDAQSAVAREYGALSWAGLLAQVEEVRAKAGITPETEATFVDRATSEGNFGRYLDLYPSLPTYGPTTALVCGKADRVKALIAADRSFATAKLGPQDWTPIEYVCYSKLHHIRREAHDSLLECARALLDAGADPNSHHPWSGDPKAKLSALYGASDVSAHPGLVRLLLEHGANPNDGESVYHAAQHNRREILQALLDHKADISARDAYYTNTPLFFVAGYRPTDPGYDEAMSGIEWLLEHGADPNVPCGSTGATPLHAAARCGGTTLVDSLLRHGANPSAKNQEGRTPFELALLTGNRYAAKAIENSGGAHELSPTTAFLAACAAGDSEATSKMLDRRRSLVAEIGDHAGFVFTKLAEFGVLDGVREMVRVGFDPTVKSREGWTPLHIACFCGHLPVVQLLAKHNPPLDIRDDHYDASPLGWALHAFRFHRTPGADYPAIVRALLAAGADHQQVIDWMDNWEDAPEGLAQELLA